MCVLAPNVHRPRACRALKRDVYLCATRRSSPRRGCTECAASSSLPPISTQKRWVSTQTYAELRRGLSPACQCPFVVVVTVPAGCVWWFPVQAGRVAVVGELYKLSQIDGVVDEGSLYGQIVRAQAAIGNVQEAYKLLREGFNGARFNNLYVPAAASIIRACDSAEMLDKSFELLQELVAKQRIMPIAIFIDLVTACYRYGSAARAYDVIQMLLSTKIVPTEEFYNAVLSVCVKDNRPDIAQVCVHAGVASCFIVR